jgi:DNA-binding MarR family transcriptional regulator
MKLRRTAGRHAGAGGQATIAALEREMSVLVRRAMRRLWSHEGSDGGLDRWTYAMLIRLSEDGPMRVGEVAKRFGIDKSNASRHLAKLSEGGLVEASPDERDARSSIVRVTALGIERLEQARVARMEPIRAVFATWPEEDRRDFARLLARLNADLDQMSGSSPE